LLVSEPHSVTQRAVLMEDSDMVVWWGTEVECVAALERRIREGSLSVTEGVRAYRILAELAACWVEVPASAAVRGAARRLLSSHVPRAADSLQLAAAVVVARGEATSLPFVCLDNRLLLAAVREGFPVLP